MNFHDGRAGVHAARAVSSRHARPGRRDAAGIAGGCLRRNTEMAAARLAPAGDPRQL
ncbi:MAG: hypothetical protein JNJ60_14475 [Rhodocyclaceae bacterium]|nr:hypothetical protein [Rhodocyclaceae bacterium]